MLKVIPIGELDHPDMFKDRDLWLGNKNGDWVVVDEDGAPYARYINREDAEHYVKVTEDVKFEEIRTMKELLDEIDKMVNRGEHEEK